MTSGPSGSAMGLRSHGRTSGSVRTLPSEPVTVDKVWRALEGVIDPCSRFNGSYLSLVDLGMIDDVRLDSEGIAHVRLFLDDPTCLYLVEIDRHVRDAVLALEGVAGVETSLTADRLWGAERMTQAAREKLAARGSTVIPADALGRIGAASA